MFEVLKDLAEGAPLEKIFAGLIRVAKERGLNATIATGADGRARLEIEDGETEDAKALARACSHVAMIALERQRKQTEVAVLYHDFNNLLMGMLSCTSMALKRLPTDSPVRVFLEEAKSAGERASRLARGVVGPQSRLRADSSGATVLVVEDDELVRLTIVRHLRAGGYRTKEASSGAAALELMRQEGAPDLLLTDMTMPDMNGLELIAQARATYGDLKALFMSGYIGTERVASLAADGVAFLEKPFAEAALTQKIREVLG
jgi:CheY-like chemotaxis protein